MKKMIEKAVQSAFFLTMLMFVCSLTVPAFASNTKNSYASTESESSAVSSDSIESESTSSKAPTETVGNDAAGNGIFINFDSIINEVGVNADQATVQAYLSEVLKNVQEANFNTIYIDTWREGSASWYSDQIPEKNNYGFSMFDYMVQVAAKRNLEVVLWIDPINQGLGKHVGENYYEESTSSKTVFYDFSKDEDYINAVNEINNLLDSVKRYENVKGVLMETETSSENFKKEPYLETGEDVRYKFTKQVGGIVKERGLSFGVLNTGFYANQFGLEQKPGEQFGANTEMLKEPVINWLSGVGADYFMPGINAYMSVADQKTYTTDGTLVKLPGYLERLAFCKDLFEGTSVLWKPVIMQPKDCDTHEMVTQVILMQNVTNNGFGYMDYTRLVNGEDDLMDRIGELLSDRELRDLDIDPTFRVTRPSKDTTVYTETYYIMGVADPDQSLTVDGKAVEDRGKNGSFGYYVTLDMGKNTFTFKQGNEEKSVTITRATASTTEATPKQIGVITQSSMVPTSDTPVYLSNSIASVKFACTGPSGATITANFEGQTVKLSQDKTADTGIAASFSGSTKLTKSYSPDQVTDMGKVTYTLQYNGTTKTFTSTGSYYAVGSEAKLYVQAFDTLTQTYGGARSASQAASDYDYYGVLNTGTIAEVDLDILYGDRIDTLSTYPLQDGGYVLKNKVNIVPTENLPTTIDSNGNFVVSNVLYQASELQETLRLVGASNSAFLVDESNGEFFISFYQVSLNEEAKTKLEAFAKAFSKISTHLSDLTFKEKSGVLTLKFKTDNLIRGYAVEYDGEDTLLTLRFANVNLGVNEKLPLEGMTVVLDPGHGGVDGGAPGPAQEWGPTEKDLSIQIAHSVRDKLEALGATVYMTRTYDIAVELYDRAAFMEKVRPDAFLSIHLNSLNENKNAGAVDGVKIYYYNEYSDLLAQNIVDEVSYNTGRDNNGIEEGAYVIARPTVAPSVLCELGFFPNPMEYSNMLDETDIDRTAQAIVNGYLATLS